MKISEISKKLCHKENWTEELAYVHVSRLIVGFILGFIFGIVLYWSLS